MFEDVIKERAIAVSINQSFKLYDSLLEGPKRQESIYECAHRMWVINESKLEDIELVLAEYGGNILAVFKPNRWDEYPNNGKSRRFGFYGDNVSAKYPEYLKLHISKKQGEIAPVRFVGNWN